VADEHVHDIGRVVQRVVDAEHVTAGEPEYVADSLRPERVDDGPACGPLLLHGRVIEAEVHFGYKTGVSIQ
jgi:hypothetical protein